MDAFFKDIKYGNFVASEHELYPVTFDSYSNDTSSFGMGGESQEEYIGRKTIPVDYGTAYQHKLEFSITFIPNPCRKNKLEFTNHEIRSILRELTGKQFYEDFYFLDTNGFFDEQLHFRVKLTDDPERIKINGITGFKFHFTCDSFWAYTAPKTVTLNLTPGQKFYLYNQSDELNNYLYPVMKIQNCVGDLCITNSSDNMRKTKISGLTSNETVTLDSVNDTLSSSIVRNIPFNLNFPRLIPYKNEFTVDNSCTLTVTFTELRKVVF